MKAYWNITKSTIPVTLSVIFLFINNQENVFAAPPRPHLCRPEQRDALVKLKNELEVFISPFGYNCYVNGTILTPHPKTVSWEINNDGCTWEGITCNPDLHSLTALDLSSNDFNGQIMSSLGNLSLLTSLDLSYNRFSGQIPSSIGNLSHLTSLDLSDNQLSGQLPSWIGNLSHLTQLDLSSNNFSGQIPSTIGKLSHPTFLVLSSNQFVGQIPSSFGNLNRLLSLVLDSNMLTGNFPIALLNMTILYLLDLSGNHNKLKGQVPGWLWTLPYLRHVDLSNNNLINFERSPRSGPSLMMAALLVSNNNFTGNIPSFICDLPSLRTLDLSNNNFDGVIPSCMANLRRTLTDLNLGQNRLHGGLPEYIFKYLRSFDVGHNQLTGKLPRALIHSTYLEVLNFLYYALTYSTDRYYFKLPSLSCKSSTYRITTSTELCRQTTFVKWSAMSSLSTNEDKLNRKYMGDVYSYDSLVLMDKGVVMELVRILKIYTALDFSRNKLEGKIPRSIGLLKELHVLNLSNNAFTGHIPSSMGNLRALESLDVSQNQLSGEIPQELGSLSYLAYMNFSHNQLAGLVPGGTQFRRQNCSSFEGNKGLFGPSLDEDCRDNIHTPASHKQYETTEESDEEVLSWIAAVIGAVPGVILGLTIGYILVSYRPEWFVNPCVRKKHKHRRRSNATH
ncbi:BnaC03g73300D [Brassica napus]|uniref:BnaC03g73300D protein n=1 Tax=Brassica napus TaxID=3708 RepID=A0A078JDE2_BRANA|nr:BnaC03g73300D [Brassica napus]